MVVNSGEVLPEFFSAGSGGSEASPELCCARFWLLRRCPLGKDSLSQEFVAGRSWWQLLRRALPVVWVVSVIACSARFPFPSQAGPQGLQRLNQASWLVVPRLTLPASWVASDQDRPLGAAADEQRCSDSDGVRWGRTASHRASLRLRDGAESTAVDARRRLDVWGGG
ncbi:hypothetical protein Taro_044205 [Colocasia esculenta]|uniref:Uncharacterized protein n=1 Tax=Colocasia esculenta TaxID=4460 RepID=A0A843WN44_COLES|nr:hypothetical protein [Colocasia esculenta]